MKCIVCEKEFESSRSDAKFCSSSCKLKFNRNKDKFLPVEHTEIVVDEGVIEIVEDIIDIEFPHYRLSNRTDSGYWEEDYTNEAIVYKSKRWSDVPFNAVPIIKRGNPPMPSYMNGREYYLWQLTGFKVVDNKAIIFNPIPKYENVTVKMGGDGSNMWSGRY